MAAAVEAEKVGFFECWIGGASLFGAVVDEADDDDADIGGGGDDAGDDDALRCVDFFPISSAGLFRY
jgi:hypothetical protein